MSELGVLQEGRMRRPSRRAMRRARRRRRMAVTLLSAVLGVAVLLVFMDAVASDPRSSARGHHAEPVASAAGRRETSTATGYAVSLAPQSERVAVHFKLPVRSGLMFDLNSGRVLWQRESMDRLPIASLTKMMTALIVVKRTAPTDRVLVTRAAIDYSGSGVGLLPLHKYVSVETMLYGLLLPSGNDAAIALAQHVAGTQARFVALMNARARQLGLGCTHFASVSGIVDRGNYSCARDLAHIAHLVLADPLLARIVATARAVRTFPIKGGKLYLYNNNPLLRRGYPGADGVKTGFTDAAGRCLVVTARRGRAWLGVILLHSQDPPDQATELLDAGFARLAASARPA